VAVELAVENLLPGAEVEFPLRDGDDDLPTHDLPLQVGVGVILAGAVVVVVGGVGVEGCELLQPHAEVMVQAALVVVDKNGTASSWPHFIAVLLTCIYPAPTFPRKPRKLKTLIPPELLDFYRPIYEAIKELRDQGKSLPEILVEIGARGFRTRTGKRFRHTSQLCKIFRSFERRPGGGATPR
jgi:hypothetical protein